MQKQTEQAANGVALMGLALIFLLNFIWPGILFVGAAHALTKGILGNRPKEISNAVWLIGLGLAFALQNFFLPVLLATIGIGSLLSAAIGRGKPSEEEVREMEKRKNEEILREEKAKRGSRVMLGDDGELIEISDDEEEEIIRNHRR